MVKKDMERMDSSITNTEAKWRVEGHQLMQAYLGGHMLTWKMTFKIIFLCVCVI